MPAHDHQRDRQDLKPDREQQQPAQHVRIGAIEVGEEHDCDRHNLCDAAKQASDGKLRLGMLGLATELAEDFFRQQLQLRGRRASLAR